MLTTVTNPSTEIYLGDKINNDSFKVPHEFFDEDISPSTFPCFSTSENLSHIPLIPISEFSKRQVLTVYKS